MRQGDLVSATMFEPRAGGPALSDGQAGSHLLRIGEERAAALAALLPDFGIERRLPERPSGIVAWSDSRYLGRARARAAKLGVPLILLGCGLLRSPPGPRTARPVLSATAYGITGPNSPADILDPGRVLATCGWETPDLLARAAGVRRDFVSRRLGGPWWDSAAHPGLPRSDRIALVIADEGKGFGAHRSPSPALLRDMLDAASARYPPQRIWLLAPNQGARRGHLSGIFGDAASKGCTVLTRPVDRWEAIERADCVYTAGGETGFLAVLAGAGVRCFADSFYAGWGVTTDQASVPQKLFHRTIDEVFAGACLVATRCLDPFRNKPAAFEDILEIIGEWHRIEAANRAIAVCLGMSFWKRRQITDFLRSSAGRPAFRRSTRAALAKAQARSGGAIAVWASRAPAGLAEAAHRCRVPLIRVEDGFVRSVGLGSDFMPAASLVLDTRGMHFDPSVRSDLERILCESEFDARLIERARGLIAQLVARSVTKYNLGRLVLSIEWPAGRRRILVPGQVEDDLSVRLGGEGVSGNFDLLGRVRAANPDAFILYKPHPDVEAGHRKGSIPDELARTFADLIVRDVSTAALLAAIDEVHTLTSLAGFEALLRRRRVIVYGRPFYAGWGLTTDLAAIDRGRRLALEELVAGALILYPRYLDPVTRLPCGPEIVIERLEDPELWRPGPLVVARRLQGIVARRWSELLWRADKLPAEPHPPAGRDGTGTRRA
jgi:capsular polysaccharide export protein